MPLSRELDPSPKVEGTQRNELDGRSETIVISLWKKKRLVLSYTFKKKNKVNTIPKLFLKRKILYIFSIIYLNFKIDYVI